MGVFPEGAEIIPNPYNKIAGLLALGRRCFFVPGFPVMAWPMIEWVLDAHFAHLHGAHATVEKSVIVFGSMEATLTPLMEAIEASFPASRCSVCRAWTIRSGGATSSSASRANAGLLDAAYAACCAGLPNQQGATLGPELVR